MELVRLERDIFLPEKALGHWYVDKKWFAYSLEDTVRPEGEYVYQKTAIPEGDYELIMSYSNRFKLMMPLIINRQGITPILYHGDDISNLGIRIHGGNDSQDTEGCPLMGANRNSVKVWNCRNINQTFRTELAKSLKKNKVYLEIQNLNPSV